MSDTDTQQFGKGAALMASINQLGLISLPFKRLLRYLMPRNVRERFIYHRALTSEKVAEKLSAGLVKRADFMDAVIRNNSAAEESGKGHQVVTVKEMGLNMAIMIFAGSETVASTLIGILTALFQTPAALAELQSEIRSAFSKEAEITPSRVRDLEYLTAVINEGLRMYTPVPYTPPRVTPKGGAYICDRFVPEGVRVLIALTQAFPAIPPLYIYLTKVQTFVALNQLPANYSPLNYANPIPFSPERFLSSSSTSSTEQQPDIPSIHQPFLIGRHHCLGYKIAWAEMRLVLARILWTFDMEVDGAQSGWEFKQATDGEKGEGKWGFNFAEHKTFLFWEKNPLWVNLKERKW